MRAEATREVLPEPIKRLLVTLGSMACVIGLRFIPLVGVDPDLVSRYGGTGLAASVGDLGLLPLLNAFLLSGTAAIVAWIVLRQTGSRIAAFTGALLLAFSQHYWYKALNSDVLALNAFLCAVLLALLLSRAQGTLRAAALLFGVALASHQTVLVVLPALAWLLWQDRRRELLQSPASYVGLAALGFVGVHGTPPRFYTLSHKVIYRNKATMARPFLPTFRDFADSVVASERLLACSAGDFRSDLPYPAVLGKMQLGAR